MGPQDAELASPSSPNLIRTKNEGRRVAPAAYLTLVHIKNERHLGMDGTRGDGSRRRGGVGGGGPPRAGAVLPGREPSSGGSRDEQKQGHPVHQGEYFQIRSFTASRAREEPRPGSALGEDDLGHPVVHIAALLAEQVQLLQSGVLPRPFGWVLFRQEEEKRL